MLTPEYLQKIADGAERLVSDLHTRTIIKIIERILKRLERGDDYILTAVDKWQLETLQEAGFLMEELQAEIASITPYQLKEIKAAFEDAGVRALEYDDAIYTAAGLSPVPLKQSPYLVRLMQRNYEATAGTWKNLTKTHAEAAQRLFIKECDAAYNLVSTGAVSYTEAFRDAINTIAHDGVKITYPSGHEDTIETATLRCVRTGVSQATADITDARMDEMDWDIVLVSSHLGARVTDKDDFTNHAWWQGKFYSRSGKDKRFQPFEVCGRGHVQGINGANCRHSYGPGDGEHNPYEQYDSEENRKAYELSQRQRLLERRIRATKREVMGLQAAVENAPEGMKADLERDYQRKAALLQKQNKAYNQFCEEHGRKKLADRTTIAGWGRKEASAATGAARRKVQSGEKALKNSSLSDIINTTSNAIEVTQDTIDNLPRIKVPFGDDTLSDIVHAEHKQLLRIVMDEPLGTEAGAICSLSGEHIFSTTGMGAVRMPDQDFDYIAMHTHASGLVFSAEDIEQILFNTREVGLTAVGNDGTIYALWKNSDFSAEDLLIEYAQLSSSLTKLVNEKDINGYIRAIYKFLNGAKHYGLTFDEREI